MHYLKYGRGIAIAKTIIYVLLFILYCIFYESVASLSCAVLVGLLILPNVLKIIAETVNLKRCLRLYFLVISYLIEVILTTVLFTLIFAVVTIDFSDIAGYFILFVIIILAAFELELFLNFIKENINKD